MTFCSRGAAVSAVSQIIIPVQLDVLMHACIQTLVSFAHLIVPVSDRQSSAFLLPCAKDAWTAYLISWILLAGS